MKHVYTRVNPYKHNKLLNDREARKRARDRERESESKRERELQRQRQIRRKRQRDSCFSQKRSRGWGHGHHMAPILAMSRLCVSCNHWNRNAWSAPGDGGAMGRGSTDQFSAVHAQGVHELKVYAVTVHEL